MGLLLLQRRRAVRDIWNGIVPCTWQSAWNGSNRHYIGSGQNVRADRHRDAWHLVQRRRRRSVDVALSCWKRNGRGWYEQSIGAGRRIWSSMGRRRRWIIARVRLKVGDLQLERVGVALLHVLLRGAAGPVATFVITPATTII